jgi:hypothetical protein
MKGKTGRKAPVSADTRSKISVKMRGNNNGKHRGDRQQSHNGIRMDSSWEVRVARYLDETGVVWKYGETVFTLGQNRSYRPDFRLEDGSFIEVKGYWRAENLAKFHIFLKAYPDVEIAVWDKTKLKELKLI